MSRYHSCASKRQPRGRCWSARWLAAGLAASAAVLLTSASAGCPGSSWVQYHNVCYTVTPFPVQQQYVAADCQLAYPGSESVSVHSQIENAYLDSLLASHAAWLGLSKPAGGDSNWTWHDGSPLDFRYWDDNQPLKAFSCAIINADNVTGQWAAVNCSETHLALCQTAAGAGQCPDASWTQLHSKCYRDSERAVTGSTMSAECQLASAASRSASVHSDEVNMLLFQLVDATMVPAWLGLYRNASDAWVWTDGSEVDYLNWEAGFPSDNTTENCVLLNAMTAQWVNLRCNCLAPVLCQI